MARLPGISSSAAVGPTVVKPAFVYSGQQQACMEAVRGGHDSLLVEALAGTGKTTTLVEMARHIGSGVAFMVFNKSIQVEIGKKLAEHLVGSRDVRAATFHSIGFQAWVRHAPAVGGNVRPEKLAVLSEKLGMPRGLRAFTKRAVGLAKQSLLDLDGPIDDQEAWMILVDHYSLRDSLPREEEDGGEADEEQLLERALAWSVKLLRASNDIGAQLIDFDDMLYLPLRANLRLQQYPWVFIDEAQDTNYARRLMAERMLSSRGRLVAVGDRHQAIYGFTGAQANALELIADRFGPVGRLPLTVTYRCSQAVVQLAQQFVPTLEAREGAPEGAVSEVPEKEFHKMLPTLASTDAVLCRNVRPLASMAFGLLARGKACKIEGRDIGESLVSLTMRFKSQTTVLRLLAALEEYLEQERERLLVSHKEYQLAILQDKVETIQVICQNVAPTAHPSELVRLIRSMFVDTDGLARKVLTFSTVHKAKGREWDNVYLLGRNKLMPSKYAKQEWELEQERNLIYVAVTRARQTFTDVLF